jgi:hypothetical protein
MRIEWLAVEKIVAGALQALAAGAVVLLAWLVLGRSVTLSFDRSCDCCAGRGD